MPSPAGTPSGDAALTYQHGAGFLPAPFNQQPAAFRSLGELFVFWKFKAQTVLRGSQATLYSMNGVPVHTAVCVKTYGGVIEGWVLYMAPSQARSGWYYMGSWLNTLPGIDTGPVVTGLKLARYVAIADNGNVGRNADWALPCRPDMNKLTEL